MTNSRIYYFDNAATTRITDDILAEMMPFLTDFYGNASASYSLGRKSMIAINKARDMVAAALGCKGREIYFTGGASEGNNWAIKSVLKNTQKKHIITSSFEHHSVMNVFKSLEKEGYDVTYVPVGSNGVIDAEDIRKSIRDDTALISIMYVNNEIGTVQPIRKIGEIARDNNIIFHSDCVQAVGNIEVDVKNDNIDILTLSGHKIHAPKGIGAVFFRDDIVITPLIEGGGQERSKRAGTENVAAIIALSKALTKSTANVEEKEKTLRQYKNMIIENVMKIDGVRLNGDKEKSIAATVNFSFEKLRGETLLLALDSEKIAASSGSACTTGSHSPSHVLTALGVDETLAYGSLRLSMSHLTEKHEVDYLLEVLPRVVKKLREY